jgi:F-type H+-transporting ATPase subunit gamma
MAKARVIIKRRKAVRNTRKITKVMQMIASARYAKALRRATGTRPYVKKLGELIASVSQSVKALGEAAELPLLQERAKKTNRTLVLVITSNRGLCGGYNGGVLRLATQTIRELEEAGQTVELHVAGKKGVAYFKFAKREMAGTNTTIGENPKYPDVEVMAEQFMQQYLDGNVDGVKVVSQRFISVGQQKPGVTELLPLTGIAGDAAATGTRVAYEFSPSPVQLLGELLPVAVKVALFQGFIEANVSEHIARMVAMKAATDNADKLTKRLTQEYNRARQTQITSELSELMGGVEAMK